MEKSNGLIHIRYTIYVYGYTNVKAPSNEHDEKTQLANVKIHLKWRKIPSNINPAI